MDIDVQEDLGVVQKQLEDLLAELNKLNTQRETLTQQIHNMNGIAMYLRGKSEGDVEIADELERSEGYPAEVLS
tara:strand:+ start:423 stop:644 length:222 start_codon:yes stop_codon:yes gene_type:complete